MTQSAANLRGRGPRAGSVLAPCVTRTVIRSAHEPAVRLGVASSGCGRPARRRRVEVTALGAVDSPAGGRQWKTIMTSQVGGADSATSPSVSPEVLFCLQGDAKMQHKLPELRRTLALNC